MPIKIPNGSAGGQNAGRTKISFVMNETRAVTQDIRPLQILVLNLMPTKIDTETQLSRLLGNTPLAGGAGADPHGQPRVQKHVPRASARSSIRRSMR